MPSLICSLIRSQMLSGPQEGHGATRMKSEAGQSTVIVPPRNQGLWLGESGAADGIGIPGMFSM